MQPTTIRQHAVQAYTQELLAIESLLFGGDLFYGSNLYGPRFISHYQPPSPIYSTFRHWAKPSTWAHAAQKTGQQLGHQWHEWGQAASGFTNRLIADAEHN